MPRNSAGQYELPNPPFVAGSTIRSQPMNQTFEDVGNALTGSLDRYGAGGMLAPLRLQDGSAAQPSLTFASDPDLGFYRAGASNVRLSATTAILQDWTLTYTNINRPILVANPTTNAHGVEAVGNGLGHGIMVTGGVALNSVSGSGIRAVGGATQGSGTAGAGIVAIAGFANPGGNGAPGVIGQGSGAFGGVLGTGGPLAGVGVTGVGIQNAFGGFFNSAQGGGVYATGALTGPGIEGVGGATGSGGPGVRGFGGSLAPGGMFFSGTNATASVPQVAIEAANGGIALNGVAPGPGVGVKNHLSAANATKAWAVIGVLGTPAGSGTPPDIVKTGTLYDNFNISDVTATQVGVVTVTFATPFANAAYKANITFEKIGDNTGLQLTPKIIGRSVSSLIFVCTSTASGGTTSQYSFTNTTDRIGFHIDCQGRQ